jgi:hypothetical protein
LFVVLPIINLQSSIFILQFSFFNFHSSFPTVPPDPFIRRFERDGAMVAAALVAGALLWPGGGVWLAVAVAGGCGLGAFAYWGVRGVVDGALSGRKPGPFALVKFFTRYAILASAAYVMLARLRVSPVGLTLGVSWPVVAACAAAAQSIVPARRPGNPRP